MYFTVCLCPSTIRFSRSKEAFFVSRTVNTFFKKEETDEMLFFKKVECSCFRAMLRVELTADIDLSNDP